MPKAGLSLDVWWGKGSLFKFALLSNRYILDEVMGEVEVEGRFSHLVKPLKDLAENWNIDIAAELQDYLAELESITFELDGVPNKLNFAEAALLIQGSATIYSKKVEYLYSIILQALEVISQRKAKEIAAAKRQSGPRASAVSAATEDLDLEELVPLDDAIEEADDIDLEDIDTDDINEQPQDQFTLPIVFATSQSGSDNTAMTEFKMSTSHIAPSGALLLGQNLDLLDVQDNNKLAFSNDNAGDLNDRVSSNSPEKRNKNNSEPGKENGNEAMELEDDADDDNDTEPIDNTGNENKKRRNVPGLLPVSQYRNPWETLDPHDETNIPARPFKKGKTYRLPKDEPQQKEEKDVSSQQDYHPLHSVRLTMSNFLKPFSTDLYYIHENEIKTRNAIRRKEREARMRKMLQEGDIEAIIAEEDDLEDHVAWGVFPDAEEADNVVVNEDEEKIEAEIDDILAEAEAEALELEELTHNKVYERLCQEYVDKYLLEADQYFEQSDLTRRVAEWSRRLEPLLDEQEKRPPFDISEYGEKLIENFGDSFSEESKPIASFTELVKPVEPYEVARNFAALLELANRGNLSIIAERSSPDSTYDIKVQLLDSKNRRKSLSQAIQYKESQESTSTVEHQDENDNDNEEYEPDESPKAKKSRAAKATGNKARRGRRPKRT